MYAWFDANSLSLNKSKTLLIKFWMSPSFKKFQLELDNTPIPTVNKTKFLGVMIDDKLKWIDHINNVISKISTNKNLIGRSQNILNTQAKLCISYVHIFSHLSYTNTIWSSSLTNKQIKAIDTAQKYCIRTVSTAPRNSPNEPLYKLLRIVKFTELRKFEVSKLAN